MHAGREAMLQECHCRFSSFSQLDSIEPLKTLITQAEQAKEAHDFGGAVAMLGQVIEVSLSTATRAHPLPSFSFSMSFKMWVKESLGT